MKRSEIRLSTGFISGGNDYGRLFLYAGSLYALSIVAGILSLQDTMITFWLMVVCWLLILVAIVGFFVDMLLYSSRKLWLGQNQIRITCFGLELRRIQIADIKFVCAIGNEWGSYLCLSLESAQSLTEQCERRMRKGVFSRHDLPFLQQTAQWPQKAAREQLLHILAKPYLLLSPRSFLFLRCDPMYLAAIRQMYPQLTYYNWLAPDQKLYGSNHEHEIPAIELRLSASTPEFGIDGVRILRGKAKKQIGILVAEQIRTIVRTDSYVRRTKHEPLHKEMLLISTQDRQILAEQGLERLGQEWTQLPNWQDIVVTAHCLWLAMHWTDQKASYCPVYYTPETEALLRQLYPHAQWIDCLTPTLEEPLR